jgi:polysaccharide biosynthesis/export protein VpsN
MMQLRTVKLGVLICLAGAVLILGVTGCGSPGSGAPREPRPPAPEGLGADQLFPGNRISIIFYGPASPPPPHQEQIREDGFITPPLLREPVQAAGKTIGQLQKELHDLYVPAFFKALTVTVRNEERYYFVGGEVRLPGQKQYLSEMTGLKAVQAAGDFTDFANRSNVQIIRSDGRTESFNARTALRDPSQDPPIYPGDVINVPRRFP